MLEGDFFLFKFSWKEDYDMINDHGPCFLNARPFRFQKWSYDFIPSKEDVRKIPLWVKFLNFPLCCWNEVGISKVASRIGVPLEVDSLTMAKAYISFARVYVQVTSDSTLSDSILINLNINKFDQAIIYGWKPSVCSNYKTFSHDDRSCPLNP